MWNTELECWSHAADSLRALAKLYGSTTPGDTVARINRLINGWPADNALPADGYEGLRTQYRRLEAGLQEIKRTAEHEAKLVLPLSRNG